MDRRITPFSGRLAHVSLKGQLDEAIPLVEGQALQIKASLAALRAKPNGAIDRQLIHGDPVTEIDQAEGYSFIQSGKDLYCGWVETAALGPVSKPTHRVKSPKTHLYPAPKVQAEPPFALFMNASLQVIDSDGLWAKTDQGYVPHSHIAPIDAYESDPVSLAERLIGTPYLWGCNSAAGIDCSGLVQVALLACGTACPGDSDQQQALGVEIPADAPLQRGDLIFWKGHVAWVSDPQTILHANGHSMDVRHEDLQAALTRITDPVLARRRLQA